MNRRVPATCTFCGKDILARVDRINLGAGPFCSTKCSALYRTGNLSLVERFWGYINKNGPIPVHRPELGPCWIWTGPKRQSEGYGELKARGERVSVHRFSYELHKGPLPEGFDACHHCDNTNCPNPDHLFAGTRADNIHDAVQKKRHVFGTRQHSAKLNNRQAGEIMFLLWIGFTQEKIAQRYGIDRSTVSIIARGKTWRHIHG